VKKCTQNEKGFTLVELLVVMSIFVIMTAVVLFNQNKFSSDTALTNITYEAALQIRQAQVYGILVRQTSSSPVFDVGYGIHLEKSFPESPITLSLFSDNDNSGTFNLGDTIVTPFKMREGNIIKDVCTTSPDPVTVVCFASSTVPQTATSTDIVFKRPEPAASILEGSGVSGKKSVVDITISSALGDKTKLITVRNTGQISVK